MGLSWFDEICDSIKYLIGEKSGITDCINYKLARNTIDSYNFLPIEKNIDFSCYNFHWVSWMLLIHFWKKVCIKINPKHNIFKRMFVYYKCCISIEFMLLKQVHQKKCDICHYWYFLNNSFKFQPNFCYRCHGLLMSMNLSNIAILNSKSSEYCCISGITKSEAINLMQNTNMTVKNWTL